MHRPLAIAQACLDASGGDALDALSRLSVLYADLLTRHEAAVSPGYLRTQARQVWRAGRAENTEPEGRA